MYTIDRADAQQIVLTRTTAPIGGYIFIAFGVLVLLTTLNLAFMGGSADEYGYYEEPVIPPQFLPLAIAFPVAFIGFGWLWLRGWRPPHQLTFDLEAGRLRYEAKGDVPVEEPLAGFERLARRYYMVSGSRGTSSNYTLELIRPDGSFVRLLEMRDRDRRNAEAARLEALIDLSRYSAPPQPEAITLPPGFELSSTGSTTLRFGTRPNWVHVVGALLIWSGFFSVGYVLWGLMQGDAIETTDGGELDLWVYIIPVGFMVLSTLIMGSWVLKQLSSLGRTHTISFTAREVSYQAQGGLGPAARLWSLPIEHIVGVSVDANSGYLRFVRPAGEMQPSGLQQAAIGLLDRAIKVADRLGIDARTEDEPSNENHQSNGITFTLKDEPGEIFISRMPFSNSLLLRRWCEGQVAQRQQRATA